MTEGTNSMTQHWGGFLLFFLIFFLVLGRGFGGNVADYGNVTNCDVQKTEIINTARTQYLIEQKSADAIMATMVDGDKTRTKIDFYEYQNLRDKVHERDLKIAQLEQVGQFAAINAKIDALGCSIPKAPPFYAAGGLPCATVYPTGCGTAV